MIKEIWLFIYLLTGRPIYKKEGGNLYVKEGFWGEWEDLVKHIQNEHPDVNDILIEKERRG